MAERPTPEKDVRYRRSINFLVDVGLLLAAKTHSPEPERNHVGVRDLLWAGRNVEPRILEVLPSALLHYAHRIKGATNLPGELEAVMRAIRAGAEVGPSLDGIPYPVLLRWAVRPPRDGRVKKLSDKRTLKSFRLTTRSLQRLKALAERLSLSETAVIEKLLADHEATLLP